MIEQFDKLLEEALVNDSFKASSADIANGISLNGACSHKPLAQDIPDPPRVDEKTSASSYFPLEFSDAAEFITFFDPALRTGKKRLHSWQIDELRRLSQKGKFTTANPLKYLLRAANGSGKDAFIIAAFASYVLCCWKRYKIVITSSSDLQLETQTRSYITFVCTNVNNYLRENGVISEAIDIKKESFSSKKHKQKSGATRELTGSEIITFVTKEGGRAEGHHPFPDADPGEGVILIINEAKTVPKEIFEHFEKCTYNYWIEVSSPGPARGHFYNVNSSAIKYPAEYVPGKYYLRVITAYDCPHIAKSKIELDAIEHGADSAWFKNTRLSIFSSVGELVVITEDSLRASLKESRGKLRQDMPPKGGLDIAGAGQDFSALAAIQGNTLLSIEKWKFKDTEDTLDYVCGKGADLGLFMKYGLVADNIAGDDNGIGEATLNSMARRPGWSINRIKNQSKAINSVKYANRGAELWFIFARLVQEKYINWNGLLEEDDDLWKELVNRHYKQDERFAKLQLLSKAEEMAMGNKSPNMADALVLAFAGITIFDFYDINLTGNKVQVTTTAIPTKTILDYNRNSSRFGHLFEQPKPKAKGIFGAMKSLYD